LPSAITVESANIINGTIVDADINASAAIALAKLANVTAGSVVIGNSSNVPTATAITGDATLDSAGVLTLSGSGASAGTINNSSTEVTPITIDAKGRVIATGSPVTIAPRFSSIANTPTTLAGYGITDAVSSTDGRLTDQRVPTDSSVTNAKVASNAAIALSKLASVPAGEVVIGNASNVPTATAFTGDVTINSSGVTAIGAGVIVDADVSGSAAIGLSKLDTGALPTGITVASANIVNGTIVNADIASAAAVAGTKIAPDFGAQNVLTTGTMTGGNLNVTGTTLPATGLYRPGANILGEATNSLERRRVTANGVYLFGQTTEPAGAVAGSIAAQTLHLGGGLNYGLTSVYTGPLPGPVTATSGTILFTFGFMGTSINHSALVRLTIAGRTNNINPALHCAAEYVFLLHRTSTEAITLNGLATAYEYTFVQATHFSSAAISSTIYGVTLLNPITVQLQAQSVYKVEILSPDGRFGLTSVTVT
jgi:hypothetical protein